MTIHKHYNRIPLRAREAVDAAFVAARAELADAGYQCSNTDPAERLCDALAQYIRESAAEYAVDEMEAEQIAEDRAASAELAP